MLFQFSDGATYGRFEYGADTEAVRDAYYDTAEHLSEGAISEWDAIEQYQQLATQPGGAVHGNEGLADIYTSLGELKKARVHFDAAVGEGDRVIPKGYRGEIVWGEFDNRPYLRALHGAGLVRLELGYGRAASERFRRLLRFNPTDNTGARFLLGEALVWAGDLAAAERALDAVLAESDHPPSQYLLGVVHAVQGRRVQAATAFRRGMAGNVYIAQHILDHRFIVPYAIGVFNGRYGGLDTAEEHIWRSRELYRRHPRAVALLAGLYRHENVGYEIEELYLLRAGHARIIGTTESAIANRLQIQAEIDADIKAITDESSLDIVFDLDAD